MIQLFALRGELKLSNFGTQHTTTKASSIQKLKTTQRTEQGVWGHFAAYSINPQRVLNQKTRQKRNACS